MARKAQQTTDYRRLPLFLKQLRESAGLSQRALGARLRRPQSWVYNCETANRRVDLTEFLAWCRACNVDPVAAIQKFIR